MNFSEIQKIRDAAKAKKKAKQVKAKQRQKESGVKDPIRPQKKHTDEFRETFLKNWASEKGYCAICMTPSDDWNFYQLDHKVPDGSVPQLRNEERNCFGSCKHKRCGNILDDVRRCGKEFDGYMGMEGYARALRHYFLADWVWIRQMCVKYRWPLPDSMDWE